MSEPLIYITSKGQRELAAELHLARFGNAIRLIEREGDSNPNFKNLAKLKALFESRQAQWDAEHPEDARR